MGERPSSDEKFTQLEISLAHQQRLCEQLDQVVTAHTRQLIQLERIIGDLKKQLTELRHTPKQDPSDSNQEKPPHY